MKCYKPISKKDKKNEYFICLSKKEYSELIKNKDFYIKITDKYNILIKIDKDKLNFILNEKNTIYDLKNLICEIFYDKYICKECCLSFNNKDILINHMITKSHDVYLCLKCDKSFIYKKDIEEHKIKIHNLINIKLENILKVDYQDYRKYNKIENNTLVLDINNKFINDLDIVLKYIPKTFKICIENIIKESPIYIDNIVDIIIEHNKIPYLKLFNRNKVMIQEYGKVNNINDFNILLNNEEIIKKCNILQIKGYLHKIYKINDDNSDMPIYIRYNIAKTIEIENDYIKDQIKKLDTKYINDILNNNSLFIVGKKSSGKTTLLRYLSKILSLNYNKDIIIIDTYGNICNIDDINQKYNYIGNSKIIKINNIYEQKHKILDSIKYYNPDYLIIDELLLVDIELILDIIQSGIFVITSLPISNISNLVSNKKILNLLNNYKKTNFENNTINIIDNIIKFNFLEIINSSYKIYTKIKI